MNDPACDPVAWVVVNEDNAPVTLVVTAPATAELTVVLLPATVAIVDVTVSVFVTVDST